MIPRSISLPSLLLATVVGGSVAAQSNTIVGRDIRLVNTWMIARYDRAGTFPNGVQAIGAWTTCCNPGTSVIPFLTTNPGAGIPMQSNHGYIHFIVARLSSDRLVQISNQAWVKHTFGSSNDVESCGSPCVNSPGLVSQIEIGCADTYANSQAVDHFWLAPPNEVDPWTGIWNPVGSQFDHGEPPVAGAAASDGIRSLTSTQASALNTAVNHAMRVYDVDLNVPGALFFYQSGYLVPAEAESLRGDNIGSRQFTATFGTTQWTFADGPSFLQGTILQRWPGATINSNTNGSDDGRFYVATKVTGPTNGKYHYEYAVHNRDNKRGMGAFRLPVCPDAQVSGFGFHDVDTNALNQWTGSKVGNEIVFSTVDNPLRWNSIFNFWFDSDSGPVGGTAQLDQFDIGAGGLSVAINTTVPGGLYNVNLGASCGLPSSPLLHATGTPDRATIPNATFGLRSTGNPPGALCGFIIVDGGTTLLAPGCTLFSSSISAVVGPVMTSANGAGVATIPLAVPNIPGFEGTDMFFQEANIAVGGAFLGQFNLSNGLKVRLGNLISSCP